MTETTTTNTQEYIENVAGFNLLHKTQKYDFASIRDKNYFTNLGSMKIVGLSALSDAVDGLPTAEEFSVQATDGLGTFGRFKGIRNAESKEPFGIHSDRYTMIQHSEMLAPLLDAIQQYDLHIAGQIDTVGGGARCKGEFIVGNPDWTIEVLQDTGDNILMGFRTTTTHDGTGAVRLEPFAIRTVCLNHNTWGSFLPTKSIRHTGSFEDKVQDIEDFFIDMLREVPNMKAIIDEAASTPIARDDFLLATLGAGIPIRHLTSMQDKMAVWEPSIKTNGLTLWSGYNAVTAYLTHSDKVATKSVENQQNLLTLSEKLLDRENINALIEKGRERAEKLKARRAEQQKEGFEGRKTVPAIKGLTA